MNLKYRTRKSNKRYPSIKFNVRRKRNRLEPYGFIEEEIKLDFKRKSPPSVLHVNYRSIFEDNYPAKFDDEVARLFIQLYTEEGETVLDPYAGSGTIPIVATMLNRNAIAVDINPTATELIAQKYQRVKQRYKTHGKLDLLECDSRLLPIPDNSVHFILTSPPFGLAIDARHDKYSTINGDIANAKTYKEWREGNKQVIECCFNALKPGRLMAMEIRPRSKDKHSYPLFSWIVQDAEEIGFEFYTDYIEVVTPYAMWTMGDKFSRKPFPVHSYILVFKKPENSKLDEFNK